MRSTTAEGRATAGPVEAQERGRRPRLAPAQDDTNTISKRHSAEAIRLGTGPCLEKHLELREDRVLRGAADGVVESEARVSPVVGPDGELGLADVRR